MDKTKNCLFISLFIYLYIYICIYIYVWYVRIPFMHSALFMRDAIFPRYTDLATCRKI